MWRRLLFTIILLFIISIPFTVEIVEAATSQYVTVTAVGYICDVPGGFTLTYVNDYELGVSWTLGAGAVNTMVRVKMGKPPASRTDGYLVYYGTGNSFNDTNADITSSQVPFYRAWSQNGAGVWEEIGATDIGDFMSQSFIWIGLVIIAIAFVTLGIWSKRLVFGALSAMAWFGAGVFLVTNATAGTIGSNWIITVIFWLAGLGSMSAIYLNRVKPPKIIKVPYDRTKDLNEYLKQVRESRKSRTDRGY